MTYCVTGACVNCKYTDCVVVCPVDCFYEGENMLVIKPEECIDCGVCVAECPANAIIPDTDPGAEKWVEINAKYANQWPNLRKKKPAPTDADAWLLVSNKFEDHFNPNPAKNDDITD